jgi:dUTP pyrophosphatase
VRINVRSTDFPEQDVYAVGDPFQFGTQTMWVVERTPFDHEGEAWLYTIDDAKPLISHGNDVLAVADLSSLAIGAQATLPTQGYADDAGFDLYTSLRHEVKPGAVMDLSTHIAIELPHRVWGMIVGRSSALRKRGLLVNTGIIDGGYRGELFVNVRNMTEELVVVEAGERLGQLIPFFTMQLTPKFVDELNESPRGTQAFGSTGA